MDWDHLPDVTIKTANNSIDRTQTAEKIASRRVWLKPDEPDPSELDEQGVWALDTWRAPPYPQRLEFQVSAPRPCGRTKNGLGTLYSQPKWRRYEFQPNEEIKIPKMYRRAIHFTHDGVMIGGLGPMLQLVGEVNPPMSYILAATLTTSGAAPSTPAAPTPQTAAERLRPMSAEELDDELTREVEGMQ